MDKIFTLNQIALHDFLYNVSSADEPWYGRKKWNNAFKDVVYCNVVTILTSYPLAPSPSPLVILNFFSSQDCIKIENRFYTHTCIKVFINQSMSLFLSLYIKWLLLLVWCSYHHHFSETLFFPVIPLCFAIIYYKLYLQCSDVFR